MLFRILRKLVVFFVLIVILDKINPALEAVENFIRIGVKKEIPTLPVDLKGAFAGVVGNRLIVAGGVISHGNGFDLSSIEFSRKVYVVSLDEVKKGVVKTWDVFEPERLPPLSFGTSLVTDDSLICVGGLGPSGIEKKVIKIFFDKDRISVEEVEDLPFPLMLAGGCVMSGNGYIVGGIISLSPLKASSKVLRFQLPPKNVEQKFNFMQFLKRVYQLVGNYIVNGFNFIFRKKTVEVSSVKERKNWIVEADCPFSESALCAVSYGRKEKLMGDVLYICGGVRINEDKISKIDEAWEYIPQNYTYHGWRRIESPAADISLLSGINIGLCHSLYTGWRVEGDFTLEDLVFGRREFSPVVLMYYNTVDRWLDLTPICATAENKDRFEINRINPRLLFKKGKKGDVTEFILGLDNNGVEFNTASINYAGRYFGFIDYTVLILYILSLMVIGWYFSKRDKTTEDFLLGGRKIPWWAAGLSMYATGISAISFMAIPAKTYAMDWSYISLGIFPIFSGLLAAYFFVPLLRRLKIITIMEYMEMRFNKFIRILSSIVAIMIQILGRMSVTILLPAKAITAVTGINETVSIIVMGIISTLYTFMGGFSAVIWTDVLQVIVVFGSAIVAFLLMANNVPGGFFGILKMGCEYNKFKMFECSMDITTPTLLVFIVWGFGELFSKMGDQHIMQRAFATDGIKSARRSVLIFTYISIPGTILFYSIGTALFAFFRTYPFMMNPNLPTIDSTFPLFIVQNMRFGMAGCAIAGLFAAAMSTLDSNVHMVSTILVRDVFSVYKVSDRIQFLVAKWLALITGSFGTMMAIFLARGLQWSLWDVFSLIMSLIGGAMGGVMLLGMFTTRASGRGVSIAVFVNLAILIYIQCFTRLHFFTYGTFMMIIGFINGYVLSILFPDKKKRDLTGLTFWTPRKDFKKV